MAKKEILLQQLGEKMPHFSFRVSAREEEKMKKKTALEKLPGWKWRVLQGIVVTLLLAAFASVMMLLTR